MKEKSFVNDLMIRLVSSMIWLLVASYEGIIGSPTNMWSDISENEGDNLSKKDKEELTTSKLARHGQQALNESKLKNILSFLDEVETTDRLEEIDQVH